MFVFVAVFLLVSSMAIIGDARIVSMMPQNRACNMELSGSSPFGDLNIALRSGCLARTLLLEPATTAYRPTLWDLLHALSMICLVFLIGWCIFRAPRVIRCCCCRLSKRCIYRRYRQILIRLLFPPSHRRLYISNSLQIDAKNREIANLKRQLRWSQHQTVLKDTKCGTIIEAMALNHAAEMNKCESRCRVERESLIQQFRDTIDPSGIYAKIGLTQMLRLVKLRYDKLIEQKAEQARTAKADKPTKDSRPKEPSLLNQLHYARKHVENVDLQWEKRYEVLRKWTTRQKEELQEQLTAADRREKKLTRSIAGLTKRLNDGNELSEKRASTIANLQQKLKDADQLEYELGLVELKLREELNEAETKLRQADSRIRGQWKDKIDLRKELGASKTSATDHAAAAKHLREQLRIANGVTQDLQSKLKTAQNLARDRGSELEDVREKYAKLVTLISSTPVTHSERSAPLPEQATPVVPDVTNAASQEQSTTQTSAESVREVINEALKEQASRLRKEYEAAVGTIKAENNSIVNALGAEQASTIAALNAKQDATIAAVREEAEAILTKWVADNTSEAEARNTEQQKQQDYLRSQAQQWHDSAQKLAEELEQLKGQAGAEVQERDGKIAFLNSTYNDVLVILKQSQDLNAFWAGIFGGQDPQNGIDSAETPLLTNGPPAANDSYSSKKQRGATGDAVKPESAPSNQGKTPAETPAEPEDGEHSLKHKGTTGAPAPQGPAESSKRPPRKIRAAKGKMSPADRITFMAENDLGDFNANDLLDDEAWHKMLADFSWELDPIGDDLPEGQKLDKGKGRADAPPETQAEVEKCKTCGQVVPPVEDRLRDALSGQ